MGAAIALWVVCAFHPAVLGLGPKHTYAFINLFKFVIWKRRK